MDGPQRCHPAVFQRLKRLAGNRLYGNLPKTGAAVEPAE